MIQEYVLDQALTKLAGETTHVAHAPLVTIVIVNHNYGNFIEECIRSVDAQDYPNIQCIVLDCASSDASLSIIGDALRQTKRRIFRLLSQNSNHGHLINCLSVLDQARGEFISYLDADDFLFPEFISTHVKAHLNDIDSAALSVTDQIQVDADGRILAGTCHWHQKWRVSEPGSAWKDLTHARSWTPQSRCRMKPVDDMTLHYVPAWWSSWVMERWIWSATSGIVFRKSVIETLAPKRDQSGSLRLDLGFDGYFARFSHSVGGTLVIDGALGAYRRHGTNLWSSHPVLGGQTPNGPRDQIGRFKNSQEIARQTLVAGYSDLSRLFGGELYYSIAWQLMSNTSFLKFAKAHGEDRAIWEKTIEAGGGLKK